MSESTTATDLGIGLAIVFGALALLGALATAGAGYAAALHDDHTLQLLSGVGIGLTLLFGGLAVAAMHVYS